MILQPNHRPLSGSNRRRNGFWASSRNRPAGALRPVVWTLLAVLVTTAVIVAGFFALAALVAVGAVAVLVAKVRLLFRGSSQLTAARATPDSATGRGAARTLDGDYRVLGVAPRR